MFERYDEYYLPSKEMTAHSVSISPLQAESMQQWSNMKNCCRVIDLKEYVEQCSQASMTIILYDCVYRHKYFRWDWRRYLKNVTYFSLKSFNPKWIDFSFFLGKPNSTHNPHPSYVISVSIQNLKPVRLASKLDQ